jgi:phage regulator Rha-like protein
MELIVQTKIHSVRGVDVMLDSDIAELYGVETREVNQAVVRNPDKFPHDFMFELTAEEFANLKSQIVTSSWGGRRKLPKVFTEQGVYLLATVLKGSKAIETTIAIMRTFTKMRHYLLEHADLAKQIQAIKQEITENKKWTKDRLSATADAITILEDMILDVKAATEVENIGFLRSDK